MTDREKELMRENADLRTLQESQDSTIKELRDRVSELECELAKHEDERKYLSEALKGGIRHNEILEAKLAMVNLIFGNHT